MSREMKHSGIPWIGEIPKDWITKKLKFSCKLFGRIGFRGYTADDLVSESEGAITLSPTNMNGINLDFTKCSYLSWDKYYESPEIMVEKGDVLLVKTASVGKCSYVDYLPKETTVNPQILVMKEHRDVSKFIAYIFQTSLGEAYIDTTKGGSTIYTISQEKIGNYEFPFPPLSEQQKITSFLDKKCSEIDEMVVLQEKIIEELKAYKQSVITEAVTKGLNPDVPMKDSGIEWIGKIPESWEVCRIKNVAKLNPSFDSQIDVDTNVSYMPMECLRNGVIQNRTALYKDVLSYTPFKDNDIVMAKVTPCFENGNIAVARNLHGGYGFGTSEIFVIRCQGDMYNQFMFYYLQSSYIKNIGVSSMTGTGGLKRVNPTTFNNAVLLHPLLSEQQEIADYLDKKCAEIDSLISIKQSKIESLKEYKKSIIYEYVTGKKEVE